MSHANTQTHSTLSYNFDRPFTCLLHILSHVPHADVDADPDGHVDADVDANAHADVDADADSDADNDADAE